MTLFDFMHAHPYISCIMFLFGMEESCRTVFRIYNRTMRARNIANSGWPPAHCDADGDFKVVERE